MCFQGVFLAFTKRGCRIVHEEAINRENWELLRLPGLLGSKHWQRCIQGLDFRDQ
jgi:hypothetical protein